MMVFFGDLMLVTAGMSCIFSVMPVAHSRWSFHGVTLVTFMSVVAYIHPLLERVGRKASFCH